jgi:hypothetical protein
MLLCGQWAATAERKRKKKKARHFPFSNENIYEKWGGLNKGKRGGDLRGFFPPPLLDQQVKLQPSQQEKEKRKVKNKIKNG